MDGGLIIDKPAGWTSHDVVAKIRRVLKMQRIGHAGTLDPFATGLLILCLGKATRLTNLLAGSDKTYVGEMRFGFATDTYDIDGKPITEYQQPHLTEDLLRQAFAKFTGPISQRPPMFSAKKVEGKPLYKYARKGIEVERGLKQVTIHSLILHALKGEVASFEVTCSTGTYVRALAHDIGELLGCGAHLISLSRTRSGPFGIEQTLKIKNQEETMSDPEYYRRHLLSVADLLPEAPALTVSAATSAKILHGEHFALMDIRNKADLAPNVGAAALYRVFSESGELIAITERAGPLFHPKIVLNNE
jgi:tRNA pseudouridine55 synthase